MDRPGWIVVHSNSAPHARHCARRFALSVPQSRQRTYMARANRLVINALNPRIATSTIMFNRTSFN